MSAADKKAILEARIAQLRNRRAAAKVTQTNSEEHLCSPPDSPSLFTSPASPVIAPISIDINPSSSSEETAASPQPTVSALSLVNSKRLNRISHRLNYPPLAALLDSPTSPQRSTPPSSPELSPSPSQESPLSLDQLSSTTASIVNPKRLHRISSRFGLSPLNLDAQSGVLPSTPPRSPSPLVFAEKTDPLPHVPPLLNAALSSPPPAVDSPILAPVVDSPPATDSPNEPHLLLPSSIASLLDLPFPGSPPVRAFSPPTPSPLSSSPSSLSVDESKAGLDTPSASSQIVDSPCASPIDASPLVASPIDASSIVASPIVASSIVLPTISTPSIDSPISDSPIIISSRSDTSMIDSQIIISSSVDTLVVEIDSPATDASIIDPKDMQSPPHVDAHSPLLASTSTADSPRTQVDVDSPAIMASIASPADQQPASLPKGLRPSPRGSRVGTLTSPSSSPLRIRPSSLPFPPEDALTWEYFLNKARDLLSPLDQGKCALDSLQESFQDGLSFSKLARALDLLQTLRVLLHMMRESNLGQTEDAQRTTAALRAFEEIIDAQAPLSSESVESRFSLIRPVLLEAFAAFDIAFSPPSAEILPAAAELSSNEPLLQATSSIEEFSIGKSVSSSTESHSLVSPVSSVESHTSYSSPSLSDVHKPPAQTDPVIASSSSDLTIADHCARPGNEIPSGQESRSSLSGESPPKDCVVPVVEPPNMPVRSMSSNQIANSPRKSPSNLSKVKSSLKLALSSGDKKKRSSRAGMLPTSSSVSNISFSASPPASPETSGLSSPRRMIRAFSKRHLPKQGKSHSASSLDSPKHSPSPPSLLSRSLATDVMKQPLVQISHHDRILDEVTNVWDEVGKNNLYLRSPSASADTNEDPYNVRLATLNQLIALLTDGRPKSREEATRLEQFTSTFFATYESYATSELVFQKLVQRFNIPPSIQETMSPDQVIGIRKSVLSVLRYWAMNKLSDFKLPGFSAQVTRFAKDAQTNFSQSEIKISARFLEKTIDKLLMTGTYQPLQRADMMVSSPPDSLIPAHRWEPLSRYGLCDVAPLEVARQLCLMDYHVYAEIRHSEVLRCNWRDPATQYRSTGGNMMALINQFNLTSSRFAQLILDQRSLSTRQNVLNFILKVMEHLYEFNNFSSLMAVLSALDWSPVHRLQHTFDGLNAKQQMALRNWHTLFGNNMSYRNYRTRYTAIKPPAIPFAGVHLSDLTFVEDGNPDEVNGLINFSKFTMIHAIADQLFKHQSYPYHFRLVPNVQKLFEAIPGLSEEEAFNISLQIEPRGADSRSLS